MTTYADLEMQMRVLGDNIRGETEKLQLKALRTVVDDFLRGAHGEALDMTLDDLLALPPEKRVEVFRAAVASRTDGGKKADGFPAGYEPTALEMLRMTPQA